jgi:hypothetical protein
VNARAEKAAREVLELMDLSFMGAFTPTLQKTIAAIIAQNFPEPEVPVPSEECRDGSDWEAIAQSVEAEKKHKEVL